MLIYIIELAAWGNPEFISTLQNMIKYFLKAHHLPEAIFLLCHKIYEGNRVQLKTSLSLTFKVNIFQENSKKAIYFKLQPFSSD